MRYQPLPSYTDKSQITHILKNGTVTDLCLLVLAVGENWPDWQYAQELCLRLVEHRNSEVRASACLGLAHIAHTKGRLERERVEPILLREWNQQLGEGKGIVGDAIEDINLFMNWQISSLEA